MSPQTDDSPTYTKIGANWCLISLTIAFQEGIDLLALCRSLTFKPLPPPFARVTAGIARYMMNADPVSLAAIIGVYNS